MSTRPTTPSAKRTGLTSTAASPTKRNPSLNPSLPRQPSYPLLANQRSTGTLSTTGSPSRSSISSLGRLSPTKRPTASASNTTLRGAASSASLASQRSGKGARVRPGRHSSDDPETDDFPDDESLEDGDEASEREVPVRKAGFGPSSPKKAPPSSTGQHGAEEDVEATPDGKAVNVVVCLRVRPTRQAPAQPIYKLSPSAQPPTLSFAPNHPVIVKRGAMTSKSVSDEYEFSFDALHVPPHPTMVLYDAKIKPVVRAAMNGFNGTVFAYGQTASGKTHTMMGDRNEPGVVPLAVDELFQYIHDQGTTRDFSLRVSFLEIYNEQIRDLLLAPPSNPRAPPAKPLEVVGEDGHIKGLSEVAVSMPDEVLALLAEGDQRRRTGATDWNERSSRSHSVFVVTIESLGKGADCTARTSRLNLIDLAGSEAATGQEARRAEGGFINKSLLTLSNVIYKLSDRASSSSSAPQHIPYRDSKLTRYLQPALSGKSRVAVICTISPDEQQATETLSTLKFAKRASRVVTKAERGVLVTDAMMLRQYEAQVAALQSQIAERERAALNSPVSEDGELARQLGEAAAKAHEAEKRGKEAEAALALKDAELAALRSQLELTQSRILTGPTLEANARRASAGFGDGADPLLLLSPTRGKRVVSDFSGLGLGTPKAGALRQRLMRAESSSRAEWSSPKVGSIEKEAELEQQLEAATAKLTTLQSLEAEVVTLRSQVEELQEATKTAQDAARRSAAAEEGEKRKLNRVEEELAEVKQRGERAALVVEELEQAKRKIAEVQSQAREGREAQRMVVEAMSAQLMAKEEEHRDLVKATETDSTTLQSQLAELRQSLASLKEDNQLKTERLAQQEDSLCQLERQSQQAQRDLAAKEELLAADSTTRDATVTSLKQEVARLKQERDELVASLERSLASTKQELAAVISTRDTLVRSAQDEAAGAFAERDIAIKGQEDARARVGEVEDLARLEQERHEVAQQLIQQEKHAALAALRAELKSTEAELESKSAKAAHLQRLVDAQVQLEKEQAAYVSNQRSGTDALQARLQSLRGRQTPTNPPAATSTRSSRSSSRYSAGKDLETVPELQTRNGELVSRIQDLEKQLQEALAAASRSGTPLPGASRGHVTGSRRVGSIDTAKVGPLSDLSELEEQRKKTEEAQVSAEEFKRRYLASERLLAKLTASSSTELDNTENLPIETARHRGPHVPLSRPPSTSAHNPPPARPTNTSQGSYSKQMPPPLPYSPRNTEKERKTRRVTTAHDIEKLKEFRAVDKAREMFDSPGGTTSSKVERPSLRGKKASYE